MRNKNYYGKKKKRYYNHDQYNNDYYNQYRNIENDEVYQPKYCPIKFIYIPIEGEVWKELNMQHCKQVVNNRYMISNLGRILDKTDNLLLAWNYKPNGRVYVYIQVIDQYASYGNNIQFQYVDKLVLKAFGEEDEKCNNKQEVVLYDDDNPSNLNINNLSWKNSFIPEAFKRRHITPDQVHKVCRLIQYGYDPKDIAKRTKVPIDVVDDIYDKKLGKHISRHYFN